MSITRSRLQEVIEAAKAAAPSIGETTSGLKAAVSSIDKATAHLRSAGVVLQHAVSPINVATQLAQEIQNATNRHSFNSDSTLEREVRQIHETLRHAGISTSSAFSDVNRAANAAIQPLIDDYRTNASKCVDSVSAAIQPLIDSYPKHIQQMSYVYESCAKQIRIIEAAMGPQLRYFAEVNCDVNPVEVDVSEGSDLVIHAEYDRANMIDLLSAIIASKRLFPESSIELTGNPQWLHGVFDCREDHETHHVEYTGEAVAKNKEVESVSDIRLCKEWLQSLRENGDIDDEAWEDIEFIARRAEWFIRHKLGQVLHHQVFSLGEAAISFAMDYPLTAEDIKTLEKRTSAPIREYLTRPSRGGNTRGGDAWKKGSLTRFATKVDQLYGLADALLKGCDEYKPNARWFEMLKLSDGFKPFLNSCNDKTIEAVARLIPDRMKEKHSKKHKHGSTPLAFACELAARELDIKKKDNTPYGVEYLLRKYREAVSRRGKQRGQSKTRRTISKPRHNNLAQ